ncbi:chromosome segregation protein SMC [Neorhizobium lilium]|uniref:Chromosome segregation protein SMC n=1 Tax=Neorhizobium lilium TaxID=2503024 RepID=A0A3S3SB17_9HYPH|nr:YhaN family protein [Neorhizobium lilium]RWX75768.1 chromosome segregation protein SMC [Neorhizobium lilium]
MRFGRLDILRYGSLTDRRLTFRPDAKLHVVYGPNEAGKSSALSAISDLLFGFPDRATYSFLHDPASLRVGAELQARDGRTLAFRRRRGRKSTLLAAEEVESALADDALIPFLGTLSRDVFERAFGLDSASLRAGGDAMLRSGGEIGSLLFSAASGLTGLSDLRKTMEAEADGIYAQRRSKDRSFYQVLDAHDEARRAERESELRAGDWKKLVTEQAEIERDLAGVQAVRQETKQRLEHLRQLSRLEPVLREIDREQQQLERYKGLDGLPAGFETRLATVLEALRKNAEAQEAAEREAVHIADEIAAVRVDEALVAVAAQVLAAYAQKGAYLRAKEDLSRVRHEVASFDLRLTQEARRLGLTGPQDLERAQPADSELVRLRKLVDDGTAIDQDLSKLRQQIEEAHAVQRRLADAVPEMRLVDPRPWSEHLAALRPELGELSKIEALEVRVARAHSDLNAAAGRLDPPVKDIERLLSAPLPDIAALTQHRRMIDAAKTDHAKAIQALNALRDETRSVATQLVALEKQGRIASPGEIASARARRDDLIDGLAKDPKKDLLAQLKKAVTEADELADAALADAERVSRHAQLSLRQKELQQALTHAESAEHEAGIAAADAVTEFEDLFHAAPVVPSSPERMIEWRRAVEELSRLSQFLDAASDELAVLRLKEERLKPALISLADGIGFSSGGLPALALARGVERRIDELSERWSETRSLEAKRQVAQDAIERLENQEVDLSRRADSWRMAFSAAVLPLGLGEDATIAMAVAALDVWRSVPDLFGERENRDRRVRGMVRDMGDFEDEIRDLCGKVAPDLAGLPVDVAADMLNARASEAKTASNQKATLNTGLERSRLALQRHTEEKLVCVSELQAMAAEAGRPADDVETLLVDLRERSRLEAGLSQCRRRLAEQAQGLSEDDARLALSGFDRVAADLEIERLEGEDHREVERLKALGIAQADNDRRRRELEAGIGAERAVFLRLAAEEEAKELARRWVVLKLAAALLNNSMEAYRERQADPVMQRAGQIFSDLTGGRFSRLMQVYDERDELRLAVERKSGEQVALSGLSEGTGDQLYLALRLAFLEDYCSRNEPAPLILDDIFQTFDDERTAAGIRVLAAAGAKFQTILFTHQMSLVQAAQMELGDGLDLVMLDRAQDQAQP